MIVDTALVIDFLRNRAAAAAFLNSLGTGIDLSTHPVVIAETLQGARDRREQTEIDTFFARFHVLDVIPSDLPDSLMRLRRFSLLHGVGWHDCLIAAAAHRLDDRVATLNDRDFLCFGDVKVLRPY